ncbi:MAG: electron transfer flavoprotein subunit alpha [Rhodothermaceae bacterium]|nr:MAG: electron transfer flavoprotein subunit alpha [Rhodothermaceae bacterium]
MAKILTCISIQDGKVRRSSLEVLTRCRQLAAAGGHTLEAAIVDADAAAHLDTVKAYGPQTIYTVSHPVFRRHLNTPVLAALTAVIEHARPDVVAFASTEAVKDVLGALAVRVGAAALPDVSSFELVDGGVEALRPVMAAKMLARTEARAPRVLVSVRSGSYTAEEAPAGAAVEAIPFTFDEASLRQTLREVVTAAGGAVDLSEARVVVAAGRGVKDEAGKQLVERLAGVLGAAIGASRAVVESGLFPATAQIGQTGKVVSPDLYVAVGISGAIQHVAGMQNSRVIVAINKDPDAPIFKYATYGIVGDLYKILPVLVEELERVKA